MKESHRRGAENAEIVPKFALSADSPVVRKNQRFEPPRGDQTIDGGELGLQRRWIEQSVTSHWFSLTVDRFRKANELATGRQMTHSYRAAFFANPR